mgnify:CR=1 FL=1
MITGKIPLKTRPPLRIICDTKEQRPLLWKGYDGVIVGRDSLTEGDYSIAGHDLPGDDYSIVIERKKNCNELLTNLGTKWEQFRNEAERLRPYYFKQIVVCDLPNFEHLYEQGLTKMHPGFVYRQLAILATEYDFTTTFMPSPEAAENYIFRLFTRMQKLAYDN